MTISPSDISLNNRKPRVAVFLATFNGIKYIEEQINSVLNQLNVLVTIYVSDDGSTDGTWEWITRSFSNNISVILLSREIARGSAGANFFRIIRDVQVDQFDYVAFCDQDDIWLYDKLYWAVNIIERENVNAYSSNVTAFWPDGREFLINKSQEQKDWDFYFEAAGPGCTYVIQSSLMKQLSQIISEKTPIVEQIALHDWLIYAWVRQNKYKWYIDPKPRMNYRQHANNVVGVNSGLAAAKVRFNKFCNGWYSKQILLIASVIDAGNQSPVCWIRNPTLLNRFKLLMKYSSCRRRFRDQLGFLVYVFLLSS